MAPSSSAARTRSAIAATSSGVAGLRDHPVAVRVHVDEAGSDHLAGAVEASRAAGVVEHADRGDAAVGDCDRGWEAVTAGAVEHGAVVEDEVEGHVATIACANAVAQRAPHPAGECGAWGWQTHR